MYGTLKRGEPNHHFLKKENGVARFMGLAELTQRYPLVVASRHNIPFLLEVPGQGKVCMYKSKSIYI